MDRVGVRRGRRDQGVSALVVRGDLLLAVRHDPGPLLRARHDTVDRLVQRVVVDQLLVRAGREQRGLVQDVGEIGTGEAGRATGDCTQVDVRGDRLALLVDLEDLQTALHVRTVDRDLPVEAARAQQRRVEDVGPVRGGDQDDAALHVEAVHLDEQLVQGLLALVVAAAEARTAVPADGVDLVDEDDRRGVGLGLLEQVTDTRGADADEHLDEVGTGDRVEGDTGLARDGTRQQGLSGAGRAVEEHTLGDLGADGLELRRLLEELLDLVEFLDGLVRARDVGERRLRGVLGDELGLGLPEVHDSGAAALHLVHQEQEDNDDEDEGQEREQHAQERAGLVRRDGVPVRDLTGVVLGLEALGELDALIPDVVGLELGAVVLAELLAFAQLDLDHLAVAGGQLGCLHLASVDRLDDLAGVHRLVAAAGADDIHQHDHGEDGQHDPHDRPTEVSLHVHPYGAPGTPSLLPVGKCCCVSKDCSSECTPELSPAARGTGDRPAFPCSNGGNRPQVPRSDRGFRGRGVVSRRRRAGRGCRRTAGCGTSPRSRGRSPRRTRWGCRSRPT